MKIPRCKLIEFISEDDGRTLGIMQDSDDPVQQALVALFENSTSDQILDLFGVYWIEDIFRDAYNLSIRGEQTGEIFP